MDRKASKKSRRQRKAENQDTVTDLNQDTGTLHTTPDDGDLDPAMVAVDTDAAATADVVLDDVDAGSTGAETVNLDKEDLTFSLAEEQLAADVYETQIGTVAISKRTEELPVEGEIDVAHDEVEIEHKEINEPVAESEQPWYDGDTLVIPVYEEVLVTEKQLYLKEEIRVTRVKRTEQVKVEDTVRRQVVDVASDTARPIDDAASTDS